MDFARHTQNTSILWFVLQSTMDDPHGAANRSTQKTKDWLNMTLYFPNQGWGQQVKQWFIPWVFVGPTISIHWQKQPKCYETLHSPVVCQTQERHKSSRCHWQRPELENHQHLRGSRNVTFVKQIIHTTEMNYPELWNFTWKKTWCTYATMIPFEISMLFFHLGAAACIPHKLVCYLAQLEPYPAMWKTKAHRAIQRQL